jgi:hypothetical protein
MTENSNIKRTVYFDSSPIVIGGVGGSGTRIVAEFLKTTGYFIGHELNNSNDNLELSRHFETIRERIKINPMNVDQIDDILNSLEQHMYDDFIKQTKFRNGWGWKVPANYFILPQIKHYFKSFKYIHVIRHGLDMIFSENQNQLIKFGSFYNVNYSKLPDPIASFNYWFQANNKALNIAHELNVDILIINFDKMCADPETTVNEFTKFMGIPENYNDILISKIIPPETINRYKSHNLDFITDNDIYKLRQLGFEL